LGRFLGRRSVWVPALAAWLVFGVGLSAWVANFTLDRYGGAAADLAVHVTGTSAPADMPSDFPIYPGGQVVQAFTTAVAGSEGVMIETPDPETTAFAYYNTVLKQYPWRINLSVSYPIREISCLHLASPELSCSLVVEPSGDGTTLVTFTWVRVRATRR
jgi:hypothetical protein